MRPGTELTTGSSSAAARAAKTAIPGAPDDLIAGKGLRRRRMLAESSSATSPLGAKATPGVEEHKHSGPGTASGPAVSSSPPTSSRAEAKLASATRETLADFDTRSADIALKFREMDSIILGDPKDDSISIDSGKRPPSSEGVLSPPGLASLDKMRDMALEAAEDAKVVKIEPGKVRIVERNVVEEAKPVVVTAPSYSAGGAPDFEPIRPGASEFDVGAAIRDGIDDMNRTGGATKADCDLAMSTLRSSIGVPPVNIKLTGNPELKNIEIETESDDNIPSVVKKVAASVADSAYETIKQGGYEAARMCKKSKVKTQLLNIMQVAAERSDPLTASSSKVAFPHGVTLYKLNDPGSVLVFCLLRHQVSLGASMPSMSGKAGAGGFAAEEEGIVVKLNFGDSHRPEANPDFQKELSSAAADSYAAWAGFAVGAGDKPEEVKEARTKITTAIAERKALEVVDLLDTAGTNASDKATAAYTGEEKDHPAKVSVAATASIVAQAATRAGIEAVADPIIAKQHTADFDKAAAKAFDDNGTPAETAAAGVTAVATIGANEGSAAGARTAGLAARAVETATFIALGTNTSKISDKYDHSGAEVQEAAVNASKLAVSAVMEKAAKSGAVSGARAEAKLAAGIIAKRNEEVETPLPKEEPARAKAQEARKAKAMQAEADDLAANVGVAARKEAKSKKLHPSGVAGAGAAAAASHGAIAAVQSGIVKQAASAASYAASAAAADCIRAGGTAAEAAEIGAAAGATKAEEINPTIKDSGDGEPEFQIGKKSKLRCNVASVALLQQFHFSAGASFGCADKFQTTNSLGAKSGGQSVGMDTFVAQNFRLDGATKAEAAAAFGRFVVETGCTGAAAVALMPAAAVIGDNPICSTVDMAHLGALGLKGLGREFLNVAIPPSAQGKSSALSYDPYDASKFKAAETESVLYGVPITIGVSNFSKTQWQMGGTADNSQDTRKQALDKTLRNCNTGIATIQKTIDDLQQKNITVDADITRFKASHAKINESFKEAVNDIANRNAYTRVLDDRLNLLLESINSQEEELKTGDEKINEYSAFKTEKVETMQAEIDLAKSKMPQGDQTYIAKNINPLIEKMNATINKSEDTLAEMKSKQVDTQKLLDKYNVELPSIKAQMAELKEHQVEFDFKAKGIRVKLDEAETNINQAINTLNQNKATTRVRHAQKQEALNSARVETDKHDRHGVTDRKAAFRKQPAADAAKAAKAAKLETADALAVKRTVKKLTRAVNENAPASVPAPGSTSVTGAAGGSTRGATRGAAAVHPSGPASGPASGDAVVPPGVSPAAPASVPPGVPPGVPPSSPASVPPTGPESV